MLIDLSIKVTKEFNKNVSDNGKNIPFGHLGTHFDVMNKEFPLEFTRRDGIVFDVSKVSDRDIDVSDIDINLVNAHMFVAFYTGFIEKEQYGSKVYFTSHPQLSNELIEQLLERKVSIIGIDCAGVRRGAEHTPKDQYCADKGVFIIENLCNLDNILDTQNPVTFIANTYPINFANMTGLPCRVVAEKIMKIEHVAIWTNNLEKLKDFYVNYFEGNCGTKYINPKKGFESYFIKFEDGCRLELMQMSSIVSNTTDINQQYTGISHIAFSVGSKTKVDEITKKLEIEGFNVLSQPRTTGDGYYESCITDPDGNRIEITI
ncbi:VOC family protein [Vallitalea guaymasensis]|uniref:VOC family protein n=1 Tax=Vallitalea guaymasensis TaxID=1185412 RepID=UPI002F3F23CB